MEEPQNKHIKLNNDVHINNECYIVDDHLAMVLHCYIDDFTKMICKLVSKRWYKLIWVYEKKLLDLYQREKLRICIPLRMRMGMIFKGNLIRYIFPLISSKSPLMEYACSVGSLYNMKWLRENDCFTSSSTFIKAAAIGNLDIMKWLKDIECICDARVSEAAAMNGNLVNMKWVEENYRFIARHNILYEHGRTRLKTITDSPWTSDDYAVKASFEYSSVWGNIESIEWISSFAYPLGTWSIKNAIENRVDAATIKKILEINSQYSTDGVLEAAALVCNLEIMQLLFSKGYALTTKVFECATKNGNLTNMKWLHENKCPIDAYICKEALINGSMENIQWLLSIGCSPPKHVCKWGCWICLPQCNMDVIDWWHDRVGHTGMSFIRSCRRNRRFNINEGIKRKGL